jgi:hypothetical protein
LAAAILSGIDIKSSQLSAISSQPLLAAFELPESGDS